MSKNLVWALVSVALVQVAVGQTQQPHRRAQNRQQQPQQQQQQQQLQQQQQSQKPARPLPLFVDENNFCLPDVPQRIFHRSKLDGAVCCRKNIIQAATILPEVSGECAIFTKTEPNGMLNPAPLWCAYTCTLKKLGMMDAAGFIKPHEFLNHMSRGLGPNTKEHVRLIMERHFKCMQPFKNPKFPCYTPLGFHKCYIDALEHLCIHGMPPNGDFSKLPNPNEDYVNIHPACLVRGKQVMPECCHGRPLPWTIPDIVEAPRNKEKMKSCMNNMQSYVCSATCFMNSAGVVNDSMELDVDAFYKNLLHCFPFVQPSIWMNFLGPTFVFFDETLEELSANIPTAARVCLFHDKILNYHEDKVKQYCEMNPQELKAISAQRR